MTPQGDLPIEYSFALLLVQDFVLKKAHCEASCLATVYRNGSRTPIRAGHFRSGMCGMTVYWAAFIRDVSVLLGLNELDL